MRDPVRRLSAKFGHLAHYDDHLFVQLVAIALITIAGIGCNQRGFTHQKSHANLLNSYDVDGFPQSPP
jgi:hypothetical protein